MGTRKLQAKKRVIARLLSFRGWQVCIRQITSLVLIWQFLIRFRCHFWENWNCKSWFGDVGLSISHFFWGLFCCFKQEVFGISISRITRVKQRFFHFWWTVQLCIALLKKVSTSHLQCWNIYLPKPNRRLSALFNFTSTVSIPNKRGRFAIHRWLINFCIFPSLLLFCFFFYTGSSGFFVSMFLSCRYSLFRDNDVLLVNTENIFPSFVYIVCMF